jgi:ubiquinone biosynthesis monooxygenase Coq7
MFMQSLRCAPSLDECLEAADTALKCLSGVMRSQRPCPLAETASPPEQAGKHSQAMTGDEQALSGALMRVNHVGEICAQALYSAQALATQQPQMKALLKQAGREECDHLAWTAERLKALNTHPSRLNPLWYAGAFAVGLWAGSRGDRFSLGFLEETEKQVEAHLASHLQKLPAQDAASRAMVGQMQADEAAHADSAQAAGAAAMPHAVRWAMKAAARVMTSTAHHI